MLLLHSNKIDQAPPLRSNRHQKAYFVALSATKIRLSEQNAKEKLVFLFILERKYLRP